MFNVSITYLHDFISFSDLNPIPTESICQKFNDLRSDLVLMYDLRTVLLNYVFELQTLSHQYECNCPGKVIFYIV